MRAKVPQSTTGYSTAPVGVLTVGLLSVGFLAIALLTAVALAAAAPATVGAADAPAVSADEDAVDVEDGGTYTVGQPLSFAVADERNGDGFQLRENDSFVAVYEAADETVLVDDTDAHGPGEYTLEHGNTGEVVYAFTLEPAPETPEPTPTPDPEEGEDETAVEHRTIWPNDLTREQRSNAVTTTGGFHWVGETLRFEVEDGFVEVRLDDEVVRTLVDDDGETFLPTSDLPDETYRVAHEDGDWAFTVGLGLQRFEATLLAADDRTDDEPAVHLDSSRPDYPMTLSAETVSNATLADAFADAEAAEHDGRTVAHADSAGRETTLPFDPDVLPEGDHNVTVAVADAPVSASVMVTGTGDVTSTPEPADEAADGDETTDPDATEGTPEEDGAAGEDGAGNGEGNDAGEPVDPDDTEEMAPGFGIGVTLLGLVTAAAVAVRRSRR